MKKNYKESIIALIGGAGVFPILMVIFTDMLEFGLGIIIAFVFFLLSGTLSGLLVETPGKPGPLILQKSQKQALSTLVGGFGVVTILLGLFYTSLTFEYSIVIAYGFFLMSGVLSMLIEVEKSERREKGYFSTAKKAFQKGGEEKMAHKLSKKSNGCHFCGGTLESDDVFCSNCGAEQRNL